jgi:molybdate transport system substrate-binding protein
MRTRRSAAALLLAALLAGAPALAGCGAQDGGGTARSGTGEAKPTGTVTVFAASSLKEAFGTLGRDFETANPGLQVTLNFGASSALAQSITQGAPADVFASASPATMKTVTSAGDAAGEPTVFVRNTLRIAVPKGNPGKVTGLADFGRENLKIALCATQVPCGAAAVKVFAAAGVTPRPDTYEQDVKATLSKVTLGEVDAALVYRTDVLAAGDKVEGLEFPEAAKAVNDYPLVVLKKAPNEAAAKAFVAFVSSAHGKQVLSAAGFDTP